MSTIKSKQDYIKKLEQKYELELPQAIEEVRRKMEKLKTLHTQTVSEWYDARLEVQHLKKSFSAPARDFNLLSDITEVPWTKIVQFCGIRDNTVRNLCLASNDVEKRMTRDYPDITRTMIAKNVVAILTLNHYLDRNDLFNCLNSESANLQHCAAQSWCYLKNTVVGDERFLNNSKAILNFMEDVKQKKNIWEAFVGRRFKFSCVNLRTVNEYAEYLSAIATFIGLYGKYIFWLDITNMDWMGGEANFYNNLFHTLSNIQYFEDMDGPRSPNGPRWLKVYLDDSNRRTCDPLYQIYVADPNDYVLETIGSFSHVCGICYDEVGRIGGFALNKNLNNIKVLDLRNFAFAFSYADYKRFLDADLSSLRGLKKLAVRGTHQYLTSLAMLAHKGFQQVREVSLHCPSYSMGDPINKPLPNKFLSVRKLTLQFCYKAPHPLDEILDALPSLWSLRLRAYSQKSEVINLLRMWQDTGNIPDDTVDFHELYAQEISLSRSNIWRHASNLKTLIVETVAEYMEWERFPGDGLSRGAYTKMNEIYTTKEGIVNATQEIILAKELPERF